MSWTKRELVIQALTEIGYSENDFDASPEILETALRRMDSMVAGWTGVGVCIAYPLPSTPSGSSLDDDSNLPGCAIEAVYLNLGVRMGPPIGKTMPPETRANASIAYSNMVSGLAGLPPIKQFPSGMPTGQGNKPFQRGNYNFFAPDRETIDTKPGGALDLF